jgi:D-alanine-D-alanine ligase
MPEKHIVILFGGRSAEHEVSVVTAKNIYGALVGKSYRVTLVGVAKDGSWFRYSPSVFEGVGTGAGLKELVRSDSEVAIACHNGKGVLVALGGSATVDPIDCVIPALHGPYGEDGTVQGLLKLANVPFVGVSILGSSLAMDKELTKVVLKASGVDVTPWIVVRAHSYALEEVVAFFNSVGRDVFVKPANMGSSVGVTRVREVSELSQAIEQGFRYDQKLVVEKTVSGKEVECAVLGNGSKRASPLAEVLVSSEYGGFYSYEAKYIDPKGASFEVPARIDEVTTAKIQSIAMRACEVLECEGLSRVDFLVSHEGEVFLNEVNTFPGFTSISMYPRMWQEGGIEYAALVQQLIDLAMARFEREARLEC